MNELITTKDYMALAEELAKSQIIPAGFKKPADALYALLMGKELGLEPIYSLNNITVINNKPSLNADALLAIARRCKGYYGCSFPEETETACTCVIRRKYDNDIIDERTVRFTIEDARKAGLIRSGSTWEKYPKRMLKARSQSYAVRDLFGDVLAGISTPEEIEGYSDDKPNPTNTLEIIIEQDSQELKDAKDNALAELNTLLNNNVPDNYIKRIDIAQDESVLKSLITEVSAMAHRQAKDKAEEHKKEIEQLQNDIIDKLAELSKAKYDNYETAPHRNNSISAHLSVKKIVDCIDIDLLTKYKRHLSTQLGACLIKQILKSMNTPSNDEIYSVIKEYESDDNYEAMSELYKSVKKGV